MDKNCNHMLEISLKLIRNFLKTYSLR